MYRIKYFSVLRVTCEKTVHLHCIDLKRALRTNRCLTTYSCDGVYSAVEQWLFIARFVHDVRVQNIHVQTNLKGGKKCQLEVISKLTRSPNIAAVASNLEHDFTLPACMCPDQRFAKKTTAEPCDSCTTVWNPRKYVWTDSSSTWSDQPVERHRSIVYALI